MIQTRRIFIRVTSDQYKQINLNAERQGGKQLSTYMRELALQPLGVFEEKLKEINDRLKSIENKIGK